MKQHKGILAVLLAGSLITAGWLGLSLLGQREPAAGQLAAEKTSQPAPLPPPVNQPAPLAIAPFQVLETPADLLFTWKDPYWQGKPSYTYDVSVVEIDPQRPTGGRIVFDVRGHEERVIIVPGSRLRPGREYQLSVVVEDKKLGRWSFRNDLFAVGSFLHPYVIVPNSCNEISAEELAPGLAVGWTSVPKAIGYKLQLRGFSNRDVIHEFSFEDRTQTRIPGSYFKEDIGYYLQVFATMPNGATVTTPYPYNFMVRGYCGITK